VKGIYNKFKILFIFIIEIKRITHMRVKYEFRFFAIFFFTYNILIIINFNILKYIKIIFKVPIQYIFNI